jgi:hypothetical protein
MPPSFQDMISQGNDLASLQVKMIQEGYSPSSTENNISYPFPTELRDSIGLSGIYQLDFLFTRECLLYYTVPQ